MTPVDQNFMPHVRVVSIPPLGFDCDEWLHEDYRVVAVATEMPKGLLLRLLRKNGDGLRSRAVVVLQE